ncbi:MAG TPA: hypothetical protein VG364_00195 [Candidatus Dormibacteraeota bacterium]|nr:hypothetical protein [Candidatus Dormibacteraeota bacterium]
MNDFDRFLDLQLRRMLDPVVATPAPPRRSWRPRPGKPILTVEAPVELGHEAITVVEPMVGTAPVVPAHL